jgi:pullulanase/glycogen debranching enzyme
MPPAADQGSNKVSSKGRPLCFRRLENSFYYILNKDQATYANYSGAGNTLKANHSVVKQVAHRMARSSAG